MTYFKKLKNNFLNLSYEDAVSLRGDISYSQYKTSSGLLLEYLNISDMDLLRKAHIKRCFSIRPDRVRYTSITGTGLLTPHVDHHNTSVTLNYYFDEDGEITDFYRKKDDNVTTTRYADREESNLYNINDVERVDGFTANKGDVYLLDVTKIHSVTKPNPGPRLFIAYMWDKKYTYDQILEDILKHQDL